MKIPAIEITNFSFSLGNRKILNDITLTIEEKEYVSILGPNGAGKTTLLKCLNRIFRGGQGHISIAGKPIEKYNQKELALQISYIPQATDGIIPFTVYDFVLMGRYPYLNPFSAPGQKDKKAVEEALSITDISEFRNRFMTSLSGGERQKVFIAAALAQQTNILLLDEPTTFLDPKHEAEVHNLLSYTNKQKGITILSVSHNINYAVSTSRRILALKNGSVSFLGEPEKFMNNEILYDIYGKKFLFATHPQTGKKIIAPEETAWNKG